MDVSYILDSLNDAQRQAVTAPSTNLLVLAGAGSGKTRVLVHRIAWVTQVEQVPPTSIMAVTFTNKAAREMRERIEQLLHISGRGLWFGTFHGIAHRLLRAHYTEAGLPENFQILDSDDQLRIIKRLMRDRQLDESRWPAKQFQSYINGQKDEGVRANVAAQSMSQGDLYQKTMQMLYMDYEQQCKRGGLVDFAELLLRSHELWLQKPALLAHYQQRFRHILVDEFQDTNSIQYAWLRVLSGNQIPLTVVGDDDQSIYGWRGAKIEHIQHFQQDCSNAMLVRLEQNYRSTQTILSAANGLINHNSGRLGKNLWTEDKPGDLIDLYAAFNEQDEANYVADCIHKWVADGHLRNEIAILYRSNAQSRVLEESLIRQAIPYRVYGGLRFYDRLEIRNALAYLRLIAYRDDDAAIERVINVPSRGIGNKTLNDLRDYARQESVSLWRAAHEMLAHQLLKGRAAGAIQSFLDLIDDTASLVAGESLFEITDKTLKASGLIEFHGNEKGEKGEARVENLNELVSATQEFEPEEEGQDELQAFLSQASLDAGESQADDHEDSVQLMTLHASKGLEFPLVFLVGMEDGLFPHSMSLEEPGRMEEERRLCYVGVTRAMQKLVMTYAESRRLFGQEKRHQLSSFIREIPASCIQEVRLRNMVTRPLASHLSPYADSAPGYTLGQRVRHPKFGEGTLLNIEGQGSQARVQVNFDDEGVKWLMLAYANLDGV
jgi:DNA helicase-2/ATP-dependent DNA helicase PcrA